MFRYGVAPVRLHDAARDDNSAKSATTADSFAICRLNRHGGVSRHSGGDPALSVSELLRIA